MTATTIKIDEHPLQRQLTKAREAVREAEEKYEAAKVENQRVNAEYDKAGKTKRHKTRGWSVSYAIPRDLARARTNQTNAKKRLAEAQQRLAKLELQWKHRGYMAPAHPYWYGRFDTPGDIAPSQGRAEGLLWALREETDKTISHTVEMPRHASDLAWYRDDMRGWEVGDALLEEIVEAASNVELAARALKAVLDRVPPVPAGVDTYDPTEGE